MSILVVTCRDHFKKEVDRLIDFNQALLQEEIKRKIRARFDAALVDSSARSWIEIAKKNGFTELAAEMEADLNYELNEKAASITQKTGHSKKYLSA